ncbi:LytTR family DNA-binding domain-containing protein [Spirosoma agri]|uniref:LytTR family transcriptional regulator n=1 Tax=Spirosoma agri TaxID=1987381 RepID=A0A6M0IJ79_9BACT|nr:LytTR family DNA-binding domain-containing protein [Spirosoma agri]NEU67431.1 LytTR family transcriptional regulator [Spirosoma agri]
MQANPGAGARHQLDPETVIAITADSNYSYIYTTKGERLYVSRTLRWHNQRWPAFLRIHKHALVNPDFIQRYSLSNTRNAFGHVIMETNLRLEVSRRRVRLVKTFLENLD